MRDWNLTAWINSLVLLFFFILSFFCVTEVQSSISVRGIVRNVAVFFVGSVIIPLIIRLLRRNRNAEIENPSWNDNPYFSESSFKIFMHFAAYFAIAINVGALMGSIVRYGRINSGEFAGICLGAGILLGIRRITRK